MSGGGDTVRCQALNLQRYSSHFAILSQPDTGLVSDRVNRFTLPALEFHAQRAAEQPA